MAIHCACIKPAPPPNKDDFKNIAEKKFGTDFQFSFNSDSSFVLIINQKKPTAQNPFPLLKFFVYDLSNNKIILEDNRPNSMVVWKNSYQVEVIITPEMVSTDAKNNSKGYIYDLRQKKKTKR